MKKFLYIFTVFVVLFTGCVIGLKAQHAPSIKETVEEYITYPYSDPNPIPVFGKIYPYFRFEGYTTQPVKVKYKAVILEDDFLRIKVFPEIGGKIWSVEDKTCGKEMFYDNKVIKFRDISLRGPWTSGGIEFNYGVIGHAPSCSFPVDYTTVQNPDGSVSCLISDFDLLTRTRWTVVINLPKDKGWFTTSSFWHNGNSGSQPYYNWVNTGITATEDLELIYPGTYSIGHGGETIPWPADEERGKNLSRWAENDFGADKSYHVSGIYEPYFGAYWENENFGMMHIAERDEKAGKKFFSWALSDQGDIWVELLTDDNRQYLEAQSGRLFNQNSAGTSSLTPYKQFYFTPYGTDVWTEYWFPFKDTGGVSGASLYGVVNVTEKSGALDLTLSPLQSISDTLKLYDADGQILASQSVNISVAKTYNMSLQFPAGKSAYKVTLCNREIWSKEDKTMDRPNAAVDKFNYETAQGKYLLGRDYSGMRLYDQAEKEIKKSLASDPDYIPALVEMSRLYYRRMNYDSAYFYARKALSFDTYNPDANFEYGRSAWQSGKTIDALDGFEIAAITTPMRSAAYTEISKIYFSRKDYDRSAEYAQKSLINNSLNVEGLQILYLCYQQKREASKSAEIAERISSLDPFNLMLLYEKSASDMRRFSEKIRSEMSVQSFLELAVWYYSLDQKEKSRILLKAAPANAEAKYWSAFLNKDTSEENALLKEAGAQSPSFVFPFRPESKEVFEWAANKSSDWKPVYYLALLQRSANNNDEAYALLEKPGEQPDFPPFYSLRAQMASNDTDRERDLKKAVALAPAEWRYNHQLTNYYIGKKEYTKALQVIQSFYTGHKNHFPTESLYMRALIYNRQFEQAEKIADAIHILPFEGERGGRTMYREIKMMLAAQALSKGKINEARKKVAEAFLWPRRLGVGKPYDYMIDTRLENWMNAMIAIKSKNTADKELYLMKTAQSTQQVNNLSTLLQCIAWSQLGEKQKADDLFVQWSSLQNNAAVQEWGDRFYKNNRDKEYPFNYDEISQLIGVISGIGDARLF
jgi:Tfp pilus assembly protein PilF